MIFMVFILSYEIILASKLSDGWLSLMANL
jgi:hypothetical protein